MSDQEFIKKFSQYKIDTVNSYFKSSSQDVRNGVVNRFRREQKQAIEQSNQPTTEINPAAGSIKDAFTKAGINLTTTSANGSNYNDQQRNLMQAMKDQKITMSNMDDK